MFKKVMLFSSLILAINAFSGCSSGEEGIVEDLAYSDCEKEIEKDKKQLIGLAKMFGGEDAKKEVEGALDDTDFDFKIISVEPDSKNSNKMIARCEVSITGEAKDKKTNEMVEINEVGIEKFVYVKNNDEWKLESHKTEKKARKKDKK